MAATLQEVSPVIRVALFFAVWLVLWLPIGIGLFLLARWKLQFPVPSEQKIPLLLSLYWLAPLLLWAYTHYIEKTSLLIYGLAWNRSFLSSMSLGVILGLGGIGLLLILKRSLGWVRFSTAANLTPGSKDIPALLKLVPPIFALALVISWVEEIVFRGFVVNQLHLADGWIGTVAPWGGYAIASLLFAVLHLVWDGPAGIPQLPGLTLMGAVLILVRWADGGLLGLATGLHAGWIFTLALVDTLKLVIPVETSPRWLAGKPDQPLTGLVDIVLLLVTGGLLWGYGQTGAGHLF